MNYLKDFLKKLTNDNHYYAEMIGNVAEIYIDTESKPVVMLEFDGEIYHLNFRCDLTSSIVAKIMYDMTIINKNIVVGLDFYSSPDTGLIYGEQALALYFSSVIQAFENAQTKQEEALLGAMYVVEYPIDTAYGNKHDKKNKMQRLWGTDLE